MPEGRTANSCEIGSWACAALPDRVRSMQARRPDAFANNRVGLLARATLCRLTTMGKQGREVRMSLQTLRVLEAFLESPSDQLSGADVQKRSHLASGTLYPILLRLESAGWFVSRWETIDPSSAGRPRRRLYRLTPSGLARASAVFASFGQGVLA
jgi:PadR family transcriptional regulator PadR